MHKDPIDSLFPGANQIRLPSCHSTNDVASDLLAEGNIAEGTVIITDHQTKGKGQRGNSWESEPGKNLTCSLILKPKFLPVQKQFELTVVSSLAIVHTLRDLGLPNAQVKWPNDIYYGNAKIAGILIENTVRANHLEYAVVGIGLQAGGLFPLFEIFYPSGEMAPEWLLLSLAAAVGVFLLFNWLPRRLDRGNQLRPKSTWVRRRLSFWPYAIAGVISWYGFQESGLHPALGLLPIVPTLPHADRAFGIFSEAEQYLTDLLNHSEHLLKHPVEVAIENTTLVWIFPISQNIRTMDTVFKR